MKLFNHLDTNRNGQISRNEIYDFMSKQFLNPRIVDSEDIVREYDGTQNNMLDFDEFCQLVLPSTNPNLRHIASTRRFSPYFRESQPLPYEVLSLFTRLLDKEMQLQRQRSESKRQLAASPDFVKVRVFDSIAKGYSAIQMPDLIFYLEKNSFFPRREDVEAILRRCDHDANRQISYAEFSELASIEERGTPASASKQGNDEAKTDEAAEDGKASGAEDGAAAVDSGEAEDGGFNDRVEDVDADDSLRQGPTEQPGSAQKQGSAKRRRQPPADNLTPAQRQQKRDQEERQAAAQRQEIEKQIEAEKQKVREEQERIEQLEKERQVENFMFLRFVKLLIRSNRQLEDAK